MDVICNVALFSQWKQSLPRDTVSGVVNTCLTNQAGGNAFIHRGANCMSLAFSSFSMNVVQSPDVSQFVLRQPSCVVFVSLAGSENEGAKVLSHLMLEAFYGR